MNTPTYQEPMLFISDVHLGGFSQEEDERIESELIQLINYCQRNGIRMAILGDLFDYWMEYPDHVPDIGKKLLDRFETFNRELGPTLFITGNHDNWTGNHLQKRGFYIEHEQVDITLNGDSIMLMHGDGLADDKHSFPRPSMHQFIRSKKFVRLYQKILPPAIGLTVMKYFSRFSRLLSSETPQGDKLNRWVRQTLDETDFDIIICGHDHIPRFQQFTFGSYINLGTFCKHQTMAFYNNGKASLVCWKPDIQSIKPFDNHSNN